MLVEMTGAKWEIYNEKIHKRVHCVHNSKVIRMCLACGNIFENVKFPKETRQNLLFIRKYTTTSKFWYIIDHFEVIHVKCCVRLYLVFVFPKEQYESKYGLKSNSMKVAEKHNPNDLNYETEMFVDFIS